MSDKYDINRILAEGKPPPVAGNVPILGQAQSLPVFSGIPVGPNQVLPAEQIYKMDDRQFRDLMISAIVSLMGGMYVPPDRLTELKDSGIIEEAPDAPKSDELDNEA